MWEKIVDLFPEQYRPTVIIVSAMVVLTAYIVNEFNDMNNRIELGLREPETPISRVEHDLALKGLRAKADENTKDIDILRDRIKALEAQQ